MTKEELLMELERRIGPLDEKTRGVVSVTVDLIQQSHSSPAASVPEPQFQGENPPYQVAAQLSLEERSRLLQELIEHNRAWLERKCDELRAGWLMVVDGKVMAHGRTLQAFPDSEQIEAVGQQTGKFPLVFIHPSLVAIEETAAWSFHIKRHIKRGMICVQDRVQSPIRTKISTSISPSGA